MRKIALFILLFLAPISTFAQWGTVNSGNAHGYAPSLDTNTVTLSAQDNSSPFDTTGAGICIVHVSYFTAAGVPAISDTVGGQHNVWSLLIDSNGGMSVSDAMFAAGTYNNASFHVGAGHTFTATGSGSFPSIFAVCKSGQSIPFPVTGVNTKNFVNNTTNTIQPGTIKCNHSDCLLLAGIGTGTAAATMSLGAPFSMIGAGIPNNGATADGNFVAQDIEATAAVLQNPTWTSTVNPSNLSATMIMLRAADSINHMGGGSCDQCNVGTSDATLQAAVNAAYPGDIIGVSSGAATYNAGFSNLATSGPFAGTYVNVEFRGAGTQPTTCTNAQSALFGSGGCGSAGSTVITLGSAGFATLGESPAYPNMVDNFQFAVNDGTSNAFRIILSQPGSGGTLGWPLIAHHNDVQHTGGGITSQCNGTVFGISTGHALIYRNRFTSQALASCTFGFTNLVIYDASYGGSVTPYWETPSTFGQSYRGGAGDSTGLNDIYFQTNYVAGYLINDISAGARVADFFNEIHNGSFGSHGFDSNPNGLRHYEEVGNIFYCDNTAGMGHAVGMTNWISRRGGTGMVMGNSFPATTANCNLTSNPVPALHNASFNLIQSIPIPGWPGAYGSGSNPTTYPDAHQNGWGYITGATIVGDSTRQGIPGGAGFHQDLEPTYVGGNTNSTTVNVMNVQTGYTGEARAMAYSATAKGSSISTLAAPAAYVNTNQYSFVVIADLVGGSAPTLTDNCSTGQTWTAGTGGTNGSTRLTAYWAKINAGASGFCSMIVTAHFTASANAIAISVVNMRGLTATALDKNPAAATITTQSTFTGPSSATLSQANEIVLGYYAINGPTVFTNGPAVVSFGSDALPVADESKDCTMVDCVAVSYGGLNGSAATLGVNGTSGSTDTTNVVVGVTYRAVSATTAVAPSITDSTTTRSGMAGTITFKVTGSDDSALDNQDTNFIAANREYYDDLVADGTPAQCTSSTQTTGTCTGTFAQMSGITTCTLGVGYWVTDRGNWNNGSAGGQLYSCTTASPAAYTLLYEPLNYPHFLANNSPGPPPPPPTSTPGAAILTLQ